MAEGARHAWQCTRGAALGGALHVLIALSPYAVTVQRPSPPLRSLGVFLGQLVSVSSRHRRVHLPLDLCTMHALTPHDLCHSIPAWAALFFKACCLSPLVMCAARANNIWACTSDLLGPHLATLPLICPSSPARAFGVFATHTAATRGRHPNPHRANVCKGLWAL